jgi:hypothetical protein
MATFRLQGKKTIWYEAEVEADSAEEAREMADADDVEWEMERGRASEADTIEVDSCEEI